MISVGSTIDIPHGDVSKALREYVVTLVVPDKETGAPLPLYQEDEQGFHLPRGLLREMRQRRLLSTYDDRRAKGKAWPRRWQPEPIEPRNQEQADALMHVGLRFKETEHEILVAPPGKGKTVMALALLQRLRTSTIVLVHKSFLMQQWRDRILGDPERGIPAFLPGARVGFIQQDRCDSGEDHDIVIAMIQSLVAREYPKEVLASFGCVVSDEVHRLGAPVWQRAILQFPARYRLGLTARTRRKDGMHVLFESHICEPSYVIEQPDLKPVVQKRDLHTGVHPDRYTQPWDNAVNMSKLVNCLVEHDTRTAIIAEDIIRAVVAGRKCFVLSERRRHLERFKEIVLEKVPDASVDFYVGGRSQAQLVVAAEADVILATYQFASEALDIPDLDTLFLATPVKDAEQSVGRILREQSDKKTPMVVDYVDKNIGPCIGMFKARSRDLYRAGTWDVEQRPVSAARWAKEKNVYGKASQAAKRRNAAGADREQTAGD